MGEALLAWKAVWDNFDEVAASNRFFGWTQDAVEVRSAAWAAEGLCVCLSAQAAVRSKS